jgi:hypothetical protein
MNKVGEFFVSVLEDHKTEMDRRYRKAKRRSKTVHDWKYIGPNQFVNDIYVCQKCGIARECTSLLAAQWLPLEGCIEDPPWWKKS